ncbi:hypothetical protein BDW22DRAFT_1350346 [Trametopsis cervina]|nr:hypothetical protein BDW22DRAFT_1350346 [Trametopsis cervina]
MRTTSLDEILMYPGFWVAIAAVLVVLLHPFLRRKVVSSGSSPITTDSDKIEPKSAIMSAPKGPFEIGQIRVTKILVHPIKSCRGTSPVEARYTPLGLENDRKWCIIDAKNNKIITAREVPKMVLIEPRLRYDSSSIYGGEMVVTVPNGDTTVSFSVPVYPTPDVLRSWSIIEKCSLFEKSNIDGYVCRTLDTSQQSPSDVLSLYMGKAVHLVMKGPSVRHCDPTPLFPDLKASSVFQDGYPLLVASEESLDAVRTAIRNAANGGSGGIGKIGGMDYDRWKDGNIEIERFRPNIVVKGAGIPFAEDAWQKIHIGAKELDESKSISLVSKCMRCLLPNVDVQTGVRDAAVPYKVIMKIRSGVDALDLSKPCFGCNGVPRGEGVIRIGDLVTVDEWVA